MIAKRVPGENESVAGRWSDVAPKYGLTVKEARAAYRDFVENEGFDGDGNEFGTFHDWLTLPHNTRRDRTPFHKGDNNLD